MRIIAAPTAFKGTLTPFQAARLISETIDAIPVPVADGGDGTLDVLQLALGGKRTTHRVTGPFGDPVEAPVLHTPHAAVIEMADASGLKLTARRDPLRARTWGVGQLIKDAGDREIWLGVGGSATVDGGLGALAELGSTCSLRRMTVMCDVRTRFLDAPRLFGPQKGASPSDVKQLTGWLDAWAKLLPRDIRRLEGSGAAGGLAGGLAAFGAKLVRGADFILEQIDFERQIRGADLVITGEGRFDATSLQGKAPGRVIEVCRRMGIPVAIVCGRFDLRKKPPGVVAVAEIQGKSGLYGAAIKALAMARR